MNPLFAVRDRLREQGMATTSQLAAALSLPPGTVDDMLHYWQRRGRVEPIMLNVRCGSACGGGGCKGCSVLSAAETPIYRWCESGAKRAVVKL